MRPDKPPSCVAFCAAHSNDIKERGGEPMFPTKANRKVWMVKGTMEFRIGTEK
jgi:hypothetical protein